MGATVADTWFTDAIGDDVDVLDVAAAAWLTKMGVPPPPAKLCPRLSLSSGRTVLVVVGVVHCCTAVGATVWGSGASGTGATWGALWACCTRAASTFTLFTSFFSCSSVFPTLFRSATMSSRTMLSRLCTSRAS